jgi:hypothetical protein
MISWGAMSSWCQVQNSNHDALLLGTFTARKRKVVSVVNQLNTTPWRRMWSGCIDPRFFYLETSWKWVVSFTPLPFYPRRKYLLDRRLGAPQIRYGRYWKVKFLDPRGNRIPFIQPHWLYTGWTKTMGKRKLHDFSPRANYTDRATAGCRRS